MYRSQLRLDRRNPSVRQALGNCGDMHRNLMKAFDIPDHTPNARESISLLYRLMEQGNQLQLYVMSNEVPDWTRVKGVEPLSEVLCVDSLKDKLEEGNLFRFSLFASPTKKIRRDGKLSARVYLRSPEERSDWLARHAESGGFEVVSGREITEKQVSGRKSGSEIHYTGVLFDGVLKITDQERFWQTYCTGIGAGKAYGLGMLIIARY